MKVFRNFSKKTRICHKWPKICCKRPNFCQNFLKSQIWPHFALFEVQYGWPWTEKTHGHLKLNMATFAMAWPQLGTLKIFQIQNIKVSCRRKTKYGDVAQIWRQRNFNFTSPRLKRLNNCFENYNFFIHITIWLKSFSDSEERWHWNLRFGVFGDKMAFYNQQN